MARMSVAAACVAAIPHADVPLPFKDGAWMLHMAAVLIFMVGAIDSLFLFFTRAASRDAHGVSCRAARHVPASAPGWYTGSSASVSFQTGCNSFSTPPVSAIGTGLSCANS
ncbi:hypothetical protein ACJBUE_23220 (plasmid) [Ralstonia syzygii subsp. celebesensis]|uniref:hypothetical protein n=1 Tax=Ralstonia syzygii TaxID=28097 RepID=UPI00387E0F2C